MKFNPKIIEKAKREIKKVGLSAIISPNPVRCVGSKKYPDCRLPITLTVDQIAERQRIIDAFLRDSKNCPTPNCHPRLKDFPDGKVGDICPRCGAELVPDEEDRKIGLELQDQCLFCISENPEVSQHIGERRMSLIQKSRRVAERLYGKEEEKVSQ